MQARHSEDQIVPYPKARRFLEAVIRSTHHKPMIHGLVEIDVTRGSHISARPQDEDGRVVVVPRLHHRLPGQGG
jgi:hypothetical protein